MRASGARLYAHDWEADIVAGDRRAQAVSIWPRQSLRLIPFQLGLWLDRPKHAPCPVDELLGDGDAFGPLQVLHAPGHSPGHLAFWWPERRFLIAGDGVATWPELCPGWHSFNLNRPQHHATLQRLADARRRHRRRRPRRPDHGRRGGQGARARRAAGALTPLPRQCAPQLEQPRVGRDQEPATGEPDHPVEREQVVAGERRLAARAPRAPGRSSTPRRAHGRRPTSPRRRRCDAGGGRAGRPRRASRSDTSSSPALRPGRAERRPARSPRARETPSRRSSPSSRQVVFSATGRSRLMWAFIPASAN